MPTMITKDGDGKDQMLFGSDRFHILADILGNYLTKSPKIYVINNYDNKKD